MAQSPYERRFSWLPDFQAQIDMFEAAHPNIKVKLVNAGQGGDEYTKLRAALKAGSGLPDVAGIEGQLIRSFEQLNALADIGKSSNKSPGSITNWALNPISNSDKDTCNAAGQRPDRRSVSNDLFDQYKFEL